MVKTNKKPSSPSLEQHWDHIFSSNIEGKLGWYEKNFNPTLSLLSNIPDWRNLTIFIPGAGTSGLVDFLCRSQSTLILNDISGTALNKLKNRIGKNGGDITWLKHDISRPIISQQIKTDLWIDRAVLHFLTHPDNITGYVKNVHTVVRPGGYLIFAEFSSTGAHKCAGLPIHRYSIDELSDRLGPSFTSIRHFHFTDHTPSGSPRPYLYALFRRIN